MVRAAVTERSIRSMMMKEQWEDTLFRMAEREQIVMPRTMSDKIEDTLCKLNNDRPCAYNEPHKAQEPQRQEEADRTGNTLEKDPQRRSFRMNWKKSLVLAAALVMLVSATAAASVGALRERMEAMNREKLEAYFAQIYETRIGHDNYNRPYTRAEKERMEALRSAYENEARFPEGELRMIERAEEYKGGGVAFMGATTTFFFPETEMSDEELLRIIDFLYKRDYSLAKMNEMIAAGEAQMPETEDREIEATDEEILAGSAVYEPGQELTIPYTGSLELDLTVAAGRNELFIAGFNAVHRMKVGSSDSELFFDAFGAETRILAMCQASNGDVYMALWQWQEEDAEKRTLAVWVVSEEGKLLRRIDMEQYIAPERQGYIRRMAIDARDRLYLKAAGLKSTGEAAECGILVLDREGGYLSCISSDEYAIRLTGGMGVGKDGRVYTQIENYYDPENPMNKMGIASIDAERGRLAEIYYDIMPQDAISIDIVAPGSETDFVFWGYDGIFTYNLGDGSAVNVLPAHEAPCDWEGARYCALPDGRIVFADVSEYRVEETKWGTRMYGVPEKTCFYYVPGIQR